MIQYPEFTKRALIQVAAARRSLTTTPAWQNARLNRQAKRCSGGYLAGRLARSSQWIHSCSLLLCLASLMLAGMPGKAMAGTNSPRMALVVGNGAYTSIGALPNPTADANLIATTLDELGFDTVLSLDTDQQEMKRQIADFGRRLRASSKDTIGFFYYAGHGVQAEGRNYLLPVEATPNDKADLDLMGVEANWVLRQMESAGNRTNIIVLDACRNNPFVAASRSMSRGLAQIDAPTGSFISYATAPGKVALDGDSVNSPFTTALAKALPTPGLPLEQIFKRVRVDVISATNGRQIPWDSSSLVDDVIMRPNRSSSEAAQSAATAEQQAAEQKLWQSVKNSNDPDRISLFLQIYPDSPLAKEARVLLMEQLMAPSTDVQPIVTAELPRTTVQPGPDADTQTASSGHERSGVAETQAQGANRQLQELSLINRAQADKSIDTYRQYLDSYPDGIFVDLAKAEIASLEAAGSQAAGKTDQQAPPEELPAAESEVAANELQADVVGIDAPVKASQEALGKLLSIRQLSEGSPLFPPFEGLDSSYWKGETCGNCHAWDEASLCKQGTFYTTAEDEAIQRIKHPYGGFFKSSLRVWAAAQCP